MQVGPDGAAAVLLVQLVMHEAEHGLEEQDDEEHDADDGVRGGEQVHAAGHPDADAEGDEVDEVGEELEQGVHPEKAGEIGDADEDAAEGEEGDEGEAGEDCVDGDDAVLLGGA